MKAVLHHVYLLRCADDSLYAGCTNNLERRLHHHNHTRQGARYTRTRRPVALVYSESFSALRPARQREYEIKTWPREKKLALIQAAAKKTKSQRRGARVGAKQRPAAA